MTVTEQRATVVTGLYSVREVDHRLSIGAAICVFVLGSLNFPLLPMIVGAISDGLALSSKQIGLIASADMFGMFLAALLALYWVRRRDWRTMALLFSTLLLVSHLVSSQLTEFWQLLPARLLAGFCGGSLMAIGSTLVGDTRQPERNVALLTAAQMATAALGFLVLPGLIDRFGTQGVFLFLVVVVAPAIAASRLLPPAGRFRPIAAQATGTPPQLSRILILVTLAATLPGFLFHLAYGASWAYIERIGITAGLARETVGQALSISFIAGVLGSLTAWKLGMRYGRVLPFALTLAAQLISLTSIAYFLNGQVVFVAALMVYAFFLNFPIPYQIGLAVSIDKTGRAAVLYLLMLKAGIAVAPFFASQLVTDGDFTGPLLIAGIFYTLCFINLCWVQLTLTDKLPDQASPEPSASSGAGKEEGTNHGT